MDFGELKNDINFTDRIKKLSECLNKIDRSVTTCLEFNGYDELSTEEKVKYDTFLSYSINSLYWMYIKLQGLDTTDHGIKNEISRVRQAMLRDKQIYERKTLRPVLDKEAAGRFIKHGLHHKDKRTNEDDVEEDETDNTNNINKNITQNKPPKKKKKKNQVQEIADSD